MAFDQISPIGDERIDHRTKAALAWIVSHLAEKAISPDEIKGISPPETGDGSPESGEEPDSEPLEYSDAEFGGDGHEPTSADILRDMREQQMFL